MKVLPTKHVPTSQTVIGLGALVLETLARPVTVSALWHRLQPTGRFSNFNQLVLVLDFLFVIGAVSLEDGLLRKAAP